MIATKVLFYKNATNYHNIFTTKMHFITFTFKRQLNFTNIFNATVDFASVWPTSQFVVECLTVLIFYDTRLSFDFVPPFWCELELKKHSRRDILWQWKQHLESQFRPLWIWFTHGSPEPRKWHFMKNITCWWIIPKIAKLILYFKNIGCS